MKKLIELRKVFNIFFIKYIADKIAIHQLFEDIPFILFFGC